MTTPEDVYYGVKLAYYDLNAAVYKTGKALVGKVKGMGKSNGGSGDGQPSAKWDKVVTETNYTYHSKTTWEKYPKNVTK